MRSDAAALDFEDNVFDVVICQSALMFFPDPETAVHEMARVAKPGGRVVLQIWGRSTGCEMLANVFDDVANPDAASIIRAPFGMPEMSRVQELATGAGLSIDEARTHWDVAEFASMDDFIRTEIMASPLSTMVDPDVVLAAARPVMNPFEQPLAQPSSRFPVTSCVHRLPYRFGRDKVQFNARKRPPTHQS